MGEERGKARKAPNRLSDRGSDFTTDIHMGTECITSILFIFALLLFCFNTSILVVFTVRIFILFFNRECMQWCKKWGGRICVAFVCTFMTFGYVSIWVLVWQHLLMFETLFKLVVLLYCHFHFFMLCYSYYLAVTTEPGYVAKDWVCLFSYLFLLS